MTHFFFAPVSRLVFNLSNVWNVLMLKERLTNAALFCFQMQ